LGGLKIEKIEAAEPHINILIYGESGAGKTHLAGTADQVPEMRKVLFLDVEGGAFTLRHVSPNIDTIRIRTWADMVRALAELEAGGHGYKTVIVDSLTEVQKYSMYAVMGGVVDKEPDRDADIPSLREYLKNTELVRKFVRKFRDLPMNTIITALRGEDKDMKRAKTDYFPGLQGKVAKEVSAMVDGVFYLYTKEIDGENQRVLLTSKVEDIVAKDRSGALPQIVVDPTMKFLYETLINADTSTKEQ